MHVEISVGFEQQFRSARNQGHDNRGEICMSLLVEVFMKVMSSLVMTLEEDKRFLCVWLFYYVSNFSHCEWRCQDIDQVLLHEIIFFVSVYSAAVKCQAITSIRSKLPTAACWSRKEKRGNCKAIDLIVDSKSQPIELDNSNTGVTCAVETKEKLAIILFCGF